MSSPRSPRGSIFIVNARGWLNPMLKHVFLWRSVEHDLFTSYGLGTRLYGKVAPPPPVRLPHHFIYLPSQQLLAFPHVLHLHGTRRSVRVFHGTQSLHRRSKVSRQNTLKEKRVAHPVRECVEYQRSRDHIKRYFVSLTMQRGVESAI